MWTLICTEVKLPFRCYQDRSVLVFLIHKIKSSGHPQVCIVDWHNRWTVCFHIGIAVISCMIPSFARHVVGKACCVRHYSVAGSGHSSKDVCRVTGKPNVEFRRILGTGNPKDEILKFASSVNSKVPNVGKP